MNVNQMGFVTKINQHIDQVQVMFGRLPKRDQLALLILGAFLTAFIIGGGGYWLHHKAKTAQVNSDQQRQLLLWMRGQAPHLQASAGPAQPLATIVQEAAAQQGLTVSQTETEGRVMVTTSHQSFAVLGTWLTRLAQSGIQIDQLDIEQQVGGILQLQATLTKP